MATLVGLVGELIVNLTNNSVHVHDGVTEGGFELGRADASNIQAATASQNGKMTAAQVVELTTATANIVNLNAALAQEVLDRAAGDTANAGAITTLQGRATNLELGRFALNTEPVKLSFYQNTIPTGWALDISFDDRVPIVETTQAEGGNTGGSWTISGLAGTQPAHAHGPGSLQSEAFNIYEIGGVGPGSSTLSTFDDATSWAGLETGTAVLQITGGATAFAGSEAVTVSHTPGWRPNFVKVLVLSRSSWSA